MTDLVYAWGPPSADMRLSDGRRVLSYSHHAEKLYCDALFRVDASGVVETAEASGNIGGCNQLLLGKPEAH